MFPGNTASADLLGLHILCPQYIPHDNILEKDFLKFHLLFVRINYQKQLEQNIMMRICHGLFWENKTCILKSSILEQDMWFSDIELSVSKWY